MFGCARNEGLLTVKGGFFLEIRITRILAVRVHVASFGLVFEVRTEDFVTDHANQVFVLHREVHLNSPIQIAGHEVRTAEIDLVLSAVAVVEDPAVLKEATYDAGDMDVLAGSGDAGSQAADAAHQQ